MRSRVLIDSLLKIGSSTPDSALGPVGTLVLSTITSSPSEFKWRKHVSFIILNNKFGGSQNASKESETIRNPSKECKIPASEATSLLTGPLGEPSGELGRKGS